MRRYIFTAVMFTMLSSVYAQEKITLDEAINIALEKNFDIQIEGSNLKISSEELNRGNAGYYPNVSASGSYEYSNKNSETEYDFSMMGDETEIPNSGSTTSIVKDSGVNSTTYSAGVGVDYNLYEGGAKRFRYRNLEGIYTNNELQLNNQIETSIVEVGAAYLDVARSKANFELSIENMEISRERVERAKIDAQYGTISDLVLFQSLSFLNNDSITYRSMEVEYKNSKRKLNLAIGQEPETQIDIYSEVDILEQYNLSTLLDATLQQNTLIVMAKNNKGLSENSLSLAKSAYYPTLSLTGQYGYFRQESERNMMLLQQNIGFTGGASLSIPIYSGNQRRTEVNAARIQIAQEQQLLDKTVATVKTNLLENYEHYTFFIKQLAIEEINIDLYEKNFLKATEDYLNGVVSSIEVREAQNNFVEAKTRIYSLKYSIKLYELILNQLAGNLVESKSQ